MRLPKYSQPPYSVSSDFGQLVGMRHFTSGIDCAMAGAATAVEAASPTPADFRNSRRFIGVSPWFIRGFAEPRVIGRTRPSPTTDRAIIREFETQGNAKPRGFGPGV